jgi:uncharacterized protein YecE (DUF72 family)
MDAPDSQDKLSNKFPRPMDGNIFALFSGLTTPLPIFHSGTSNIELVEKNKQAFPPEFQLKSRLAYYSSLFNSVEINSTFYKLPLPSTLEKWAMDVPDGFRFTLKLWREITHAPRLAFTSAQVEKFMRIANRIGVKKGCLLIQFPAGTTSTQADQLERLLAAIEMSDCDKSPELADGQVPEIAYGSSWKIAVEFRHSSWHNDHVYSLLKKYGAVLVWHDRPVMEDAGTHASHSVVYLRFHGPKGDYRGSYSDAFLFERAGQVRQWLSQGREVYAYFNNTMEGDAPKNLATLNDMLKNRTGAMAPIK